MRFPYLALAVIASAPPARADWPQWRGPNRDGAAAPAAVPKAWPKELTRDWSLEIGEGHSGPVVVGDKVFAVARQGGNEVVRCLALADGREVWKQAVPVAVETDGAAAGHGLGPKATPAVAGGRVFTLSLGGTVSAFDAATGKPLWRRAFDKVYGPKPWPAYGASTSPIVVGGAVVVWVGGHDKGALTAFDAATGADRWKLPVDGPGYTSPVLVELAGVRQLVTQSKTRMLGADPATGKELWSVKFHTTYDQNSVTPLVVGGKLLYSGYQKAWYAGTLAKAGAGFKLSEAWEVREHPLFMSSPVAVGGRVFGVSMYAGASLVALKAEDGEVLWKKERVDGAEYAALVRAGDFVLMQNTAGVVTVFKAADKFDPVAEYRVAESPTWAHPALVPGRLLTKDKTHLACWKLD